MDPSHAAWLLAPPLVERIRALAEG